MKSYTATQFNKSPQEVFAAAKEDGAVEIKHDRFRDVTFTIEAKPVYKGCKHVCDEKTMICNKCGEQCVRLDIRPYIPPPLPSGKNIFSKEIPE